MQVIDKCPGLYCGRTILENETLSLCGECPRGFRVNDSSVCLECTDSPALYDWLYLTFMTILPLFMHWYFIDASSPTFSKNQAILHISAFFEIVVSALLAILLTSPIGTFYVHSCGVKKFSDWYTLFYNPTPNYEDTLHCTTEAVYPLQTIVLVFYFFCLITMMMIRPVLNRIFMKSGKFAIYSALYFLPLLTFTHAVAGGLIYYSFPYISIVMSMISNACHFALKLDQKMESLFKSSVLEFRNVIVIIGHWLLLAFGIVSLGQLNFLLMFVPFPSLFYIITVQFTDPSEFPDAN